MSEKQAETIFNAAPDAVIVIDEKGLIVRWNPKAEVLFGWRQEEVMGTSLSETIIPVSYRELHKQGMNRFLQTGEGPVLGKTVEVRAVNKNQVEFDVALSISPTVEDGRYLFIGFLRDVTEQKKAEKQLYAATKEMEAFTYSVSHDLRAPIRIIDGYTQILRREYAGKLDEEGNRLLEVITKNVQRMGKLIDDLLNLSRLSRKKLVVHRVNMTRLVELVIVEQDILKTKQPVINVRELEPAYCDSSLLRQVWINLISNAIKYSGNRDNPLVEINSVKTNSEIIYSVKDNGVGFDMQYADKLFGVFERLHNTTEFDGTGIGLALVYRIVSRHGGRVWAESAIDKGATFYFSLPVSQPVTTTTD